jgi:ABC-type Fe3+-siderophore transport system permease subunit
MSLVWILPLFPAEPKLGPVYTQVTHFIPPEFPLLLVIPALAIDLVLWRGRTWSRWVRSMAAGSAFLVIFATVQWPFANFLMSPLARNWFFGTHYFDYNSRPTSAYQQYRFLVVEKTAGQFWAEMAIAVVCAIVMTRLGLAWGEWMRRVRR